MNKCQITKFTDKVKVECTFTQVKRQSVERVISLKTESRVPEDSDEKSASISTLCTCKSSGLGVWRIRPFKSVASRVVTCGKISMVFQIRTRPIA